MIFPNPSPAEIFATWLSSELEFIAYNQLQTPGDGSTAVYTSAVTDEYDQAIFIMNQVGLTFGRSQRTGRTLMHNGLKILIRALDEPTGWNLANAIAIAIDGSGTLIPIAVSEAYHYIQSIYRVGTIIPLGEELGKKRMLWSINLRIAFQPQEPALG